MSDDCLKCTDHNTNIFRLNNIESKLVGHDDELRTVCNKVLILEESLKVAGVKLDNHDKQTEALLSLAYEVKSYGDKLDRVIEQQGEVINLVSIHDEKLIALDNRPANEVFKEVQKVKGWLIAGLISSIFTVCAGYVLGVIN